MMSYHASKTENRKPTYTRLFLRAKAVAENFGLGLQPISQARAQLDGGQQFGPVGREFDRQGQTVQPPADFDHIRRIGLRERKARSHGHGPLDEQRNGRVGQGSENAAVASIGALEVTNLERKADFAAAARACERHQVDI